MLGLDIADWIVISVYLLGITYLGIWTRKKIKNSDDYFMGNRRFGKILMIAQAFGSGTHTDQPVSVSGASYTNGLAGIWYQWMWMFSTPFFWIIAPIYRRLRYVTMADFFKERYGHVMSIIFSTMAIIYFTMIIGIMLKGTGITIEGLTGGAMTESWVIIVSTILFVVYGLAGGLVAAVITDLIQGVLILVLSFMLIPFALAKVGGFSGLHEVVPEHMFTLIAPTEVTFFFIVMIVINGLVGVVVQPHHMAIGGSGKTEIACRSGWTFGNFLKRVATMGWALIGVFAIALVPGLGFEERELAFGMLSKLLLPAGLVGLMIASMMAAVMSTCDAFMVHGSALFTRNIYLEYLRPNAGDRELLIVGRYASVAVVFIGLFFAYYFESVVGGLMAVWKVTAYLGIAFWLGVMWRRANRYGAIASTLIMVGLAQYTHFVLDWDLAYQIALYIPSGLVIMIVVSLLTKPEPEEKLNAFYTLLDTPVGQEQKLKDLGIEIKLEGEALTDEEKSAKPGFFDRFFIKNGGDDGLIIVDLLSIHKKFSWARYRTDIVGFGIASSVVVILILLMMWISGIGA